MVYNLTFYSSVTSKINSHIIFLKKIILTGTQKNKIKNHTPVLRRWYQRNGLINFFSPFSH